MKIQDALRSGKTPADLTAELGLRVAEHPTLPLVIFNYDQIESPKLDPIVREARGLVLEKDTWDVVAKSFPRFFNWGEVQDEMPLFDFSDFVVQSKEDGSLLLIYYYDGHWRCNTRGSFAQDNMQFQSFTWQEGVEKALGVATLDDLDRVLLRTCTYVCEFCTPWNKVVRSYSTPVVYLLTIFNNKTGEELTVAQATYVGVPFSLPKVYQFHSIEEIQDFLAKQAADDPTFEGVVIRDKDNRRWKIKSPTYLGLHRLRGEGDNLFNPKNLLPFVLAGEEDELLTYFPEVRQAFYELKAQVQQYYISLLELWAEHWRIESQKEFALAIKDRTPFASVLFDVRKRLGAEQKPEDLRKAWKEAGLQILKHLPKRISSLTPIP